MGLRSVLAQFRLTASPGRGRALMSSPGHARAYQATERSGHRDEAERRALAHTRTLCHPGTV